MKNMIEERKTPGGSMSESSLWQFKTFRDESGALRELGVKSPEGQFFCFEDDENFSLDLVDGEGRKPFIALKSGEKISFSEWLAKRSSKFSEIFERKDLVYRELYKLLLEDCPELIELNIEEGDEKEYPILKHTGGFLQIQMN